MFKKAALLSILLINALLNMHLAVANDAQTVTERQRLESVVNELAYLQTYRSHLRNSMFVRGLIMSGLTVTSIYSNTVLRST